MRVHALIEWDIISGEILRDEHYEWFGPTARCDRSQQAMGQQAEKNAFQTAGNYGATAQGVGGFLVPTLERQAVTPTGYSPMDEAQMQTNALLSGAAETGRAREEETLRAARTGNAAALPGQSAALAEAGARGTGGMLQNILAKNAELKARQQQTAQSELGNLYGTAARSQLEAESLVPKDIDAELAAGRQGWFQNLLSYMDTAANAAKAVGGGGGAA